MALLIPIDKSLGQSLSRKFGSSTQCKAVFTIEYF